MKLIQKDLIKCYRIHTYGFGWYVLELSFGLDCSLVTVVYQDAKTFLRFRWLLQWVRSRAIVFPKGCRESYHVVSGDFRYSMSFRSYRQKKKSRFWFFDKSSFSTKINESPRKSRYTEKNPLFGHINSIFRRAKTAIETRGVKNPTFWVRTSLYKKKWLVPPEVLISPSQ